MKIFYTLTIIVLSVSIVFSKNNSNKRHVSFNKTTQVSLIDSSDAPQPIKISWIGTGNLSRFTITNVGINGYFGAPRDWTNGDYQGLLPDNFSTAIGNTGEFPRGSQQHYIFASGLWIGAKVRVITGSDTTWEERVAATAYDSDLGTLSDLYQTNQTIPDGLDGEGQPLFKQKGSAVLESYQRLWSFADTSINSRRRDLGFNNLLLDSENGDYISDEDTYCVWGDYWPEVDAITLNSDKYDTDPVGIRVEQRTYSWSTDAFIYLNYRITNMNDFALKDVYFGYFMDNDIGDYEDDLIGYDANLNLGYSYDSDLEETGWQTLAGYMGTVFVETPKDSAGNEIGLTGFQTWDREGAEGEVDGSGTDGLKYDQLQKTDFEIYSIPTDVRQLTTSGPYLNMEAGETVEITIAVVAGGSLAEIRKNTERAYERYDLGYVGPEPPPPPNITTAIAGDKRFIMGWDNFSETVADPFSGEFDFEGYRVYRSEDQGITWGEKTTDINRYPSGYVPLAEFDKAGNESGRYVFTSYSSGTSSATISFVDYIEDQDTLFNEAVYSIEFLEGNQLLVYNLSKFKAYPYFVNAEFRGNTFAIIDSASGNPYPDATYVSGALIAFDGIYVSIKDSVDSLGNISAPDVGDVFKVETFESRFLFDQLGLQYFFEDRKLTNGFSYYYTVTAFDEGNPAISLPSLESSLFPNVTEAVPRPPASDRTVDFISNVQRVAGSSQGVVQVDKANPLQMVQAEFEIDFFSANSAEPKAQAQYVRITNISADSLIVDSLLLSNGSAFYNFYGMLLAASGPPKAEVDITQSGWKSGFESSYDLRNEILGAPDPYDYEVEFTNVLTDEQYSGDEMVIPEGVSAPWTIRNMTFATKPGSYAFPPLTAGGKFENNDYLYVLNDNYRNTSDVAFSLLLDNSDETDPIRAGDIFEVKTSKPFLNEDKFSFNSRPLNQQKEKGDYTLKDVKVVPNPYYVRAAWDTDRFNKHINFNGLPAKCKIRIFTTSGILIQTIKHDEAQGDPQGYHSWTLRNKENIDIASGLYIYHVEDANSGKSKTGKFAVVL